MDKTLNIIISAKDNASAGLRSVSDSANVMGQVLGALGIANVVNDLIALGKAAFNTGLQFQETMMNIQGNTGMTNAQIAQMSSEVQKLGVQSGESMTALATGFQHAFNVTQSMSDSLTVLKAGMEAAKTTGASVTDTTNILATAMHDFNIPASQAAQTMSKILAIAQNGNVNLQDLSGMFTVLASNAASLGLKLDDVGSVYDALTKKYGDSNIAITMENQLLLAIADAHAKVKAAVGDTSSAVGTGTKKHKDYTDAITASNDSLKLAEDALTRAQNAHKKNNDVIQAATDRVKAHTDSLAALKEKQDAATTSVSRADPALSSLGSDFTDAGLKAKGLVGVLNDIQKASNGNNEELKTLFPNIRSFEGALTLSADKGKDVTTSLNNIKAASDKALSSEYTQRLSTVNSQWEIFVNTLQVKAIGAFNQLSPAMTESLKILNWDQKPVVQKYQDVGAAFSSMVKNMQKDTQPLQANFSVVSRLFSDFFSGGDPTLSGAEAKNTMFKGIAVGMDSIRDKIIEMEGWFKGLPPVLNTDLKAAEATVASWAKNTEKWFAELPAKIGQHEYDLYVKQIPEDIGFAVGYASKEIPKMINDIGGYFAKLPGNVSKSMQQTWKEITTWWSNSEKDSKKTQDQMDKNNQEAFSKWKTSTSTSMKDIWKEITTSWDKTQTDAALTLYQMSTDVSNKLKSIPDDVDKIMKSLKKTVDEDLKAVWQTATNWWGDISGIFGKIITAATDAFNAAQKGYQAGQNAVQHRASGGYAGGLTLVGENGPELVNLPGGSYVYNNSQTNQLLGGGGQNIQISFTGPVSMSDSSQVQALAQKIVKIIGRQNELAQKGYSV